jgi:2-polyprenyl-3-methyl-5-hydroxy-6-metoxy-1,4-benzoquinol methylase
MPRGKLSCAAIRARNAYDPAVATTDDQRRSEPSNAGDARDKAFKYTRYDDSPGSTHNLVVQLVPEGASVLEVGCATGYMSDVLVQRKGCRVTGIELDPTAAAEASAYCERVVVGDVETLDLGEHLDAERYDAILFADVLEHLRDPAAVLRRVRPFVAEGGAVIASIPNVAHISVRLALLAGEFRYRKLGLLDDTHLRFFTRESIVDLFESTGYVVSRWRRRRIEADDAEISSPPDVPKDIRSWLGSDPELTTYQFVVRATPTDAASQLAELRTILRETQVDLRRLAELEDASRELQLLRRAHEAQARHLVSERLSVADQMAELDGVIERLREEVEWRKGVMAEQERQLERIHGSRAFRYTAPLRRAAAALRGQRG